MGFINKFHTYRWPWTVRSGHVAGTVKIPEILVRRLAVGWRELVLEYFRADPINRTRKIPVCYGCVPGLDAPEGFAQFSNLRSEIWNTQLEFSIAWETYGGRRIEHDLGSVESESQPIQGVVPSVADIYGYFAVLCL